MEEDRQAVLQAELRALPDLQLGQLSNGLGQLQAGFSGLAGHELEALLRQW
jgi:X-X-X-Leu-X-X-Gly heptad repeat protein